MSISRFVFGFGIAAFAAAPSLSTVTVSGSLAYPPIATNFFDPQLSFAPAYAANRNATTVTVGDGIEFGFDDGFNLNTADFADSLLTIHQLTRSGRAATSVFTFTADIADYFSGAQLSANITGGSLTVSGNTLTYITPFTDGPEDRIATIRLGRLAPVTSPAPEAATWAMFIVGFGVIGATMRQRRRADVRFA